MATESPRTHALWPMPEAAQAATEYLLDAWQRTILTWDVLRERGNEYLEHEQSGKPPVLVFDYETVLDGRELARPANYALVRIKPPRRLSARPIRSKRPFVVIDPRAGHGPGIGGFKMDSEIGIALQARAPVLLRHVLPRSRCPARRSSRCAAAEIAFLHKVNELHPDAEASPSSIGNCQGGWALMMLAALAPTHVGPILLAGSPISYWAGVAGKNPMRYSGGLLGGTWMASLAGDLGARQVRRRVPRQQLREPRTRRTPTGTSSTTSTRRSTPSASASSSSRSWWGGHFLMNSEEMEWIIAEPLRRQQAVGRRGRVVRRQAPRRHPQHPLADHRVRLVGRQHHAAAAGAQLDPRRSTAASRRSALNEQTIVYCLHEKIGHLGIFVSAERRASARPRSSPARSSSIETLPPGLYEAVIEDTHPRCRALEYVEGRYLIQFAPRTIDDILALDDGRDDEQAFEVVERVSRDQPGRSTTRSSRRS